MSTYNICFRAKIMYTPVNHSFTILKWGVRGSSLHGPVFVIRFSRKIPGGLGFSPTSTDQSHVTLESTSVD